jgi:hypothetical protein
MNNQTQAVEQAKLSFRDYYFGLDDQSPRSRIRGQICMALGIAESSLWDKIRNNRFSFLEQKEIANIVSIPVETLFPEEQ